MTKKPAIIFDIDETLLFPSSAPYNDHIVYPNTHLVNMTRFLYGSHIKVLIVTGRHERLRVMTFDELNDNAVLWDELHMNDMMIDGNIQKGHIFKAKMIEILKEKYEILCAIDDDDESLNVYKEAGIQGLKVL